MSLPDVPSPIDFSLMPEAMAWEEKAMLRPYREDFFTAMFREIEKQSESSVPILELGSGPGFLASFIMERLPAANMQLLDFSAAMHALAHKRLAKFSDRVTYLERNFRLPDWSRRLGKFNTVVTLQAVHELRHKCYATEFHRQVKELLHKQGIYLVCDHYYGEDAMSNDQLYMTPDEQRASLENAGFKVSTLLIKGGRILCRATC